MKILNFNDTRTEVQRQWGVKKGRGCLFALHLLYKEPFAPNERNK